MSSKTLTTRRIAATLITGATAALGLAAHADAATYCVKKPTCQGIVSTTIQSALDQAGASTENDRVEIGATSFEGSIQSILPKGKLDIVGSGRDATVIHMSNTTDGAIGAFMTGDITLSDMSIETGAKQQTGLFLDNGAHAERLIVVAGGENADQTAVEVARASISHSDLDAPHGSAVQLISDEAHVSDSLLEGFSAIDAQPTPGTFATVKRVRYVGPNGPNAIRGKTLIENSAFFIEGADVNSFAFFVGANGNDAQMTLRNVTAVGRSDKTHKIQGFLGFALHNSKGRLTVRDSAFTGFNLPMSWSADSGGTMDVDFNHVGRTTADTPQHNGGTFTDDTPIAINGSEFKDLPDHDAHPLRGSALIDAGSTLDTDDGLDLDNHNRVVDGDGDGIARRDLGAYELPASSGTPPSTPADSGGVAGTTTDEPGSSTPGAGTPAGPVATPTPAPPTADRTAPRLSGLRLTRRPARRAARLQLQVRSDEAATATIAVRHGKTQFKRTVRLRRGANALRLRAPKTQRLRRGAYRVTVRAIDSAGNRSATSTLRFRVR